MSWLYHFFSKPMLSDSFSKEAALAVLVWLLALGSLVLAIIDPSTRATFADLTKIAVGAYIGLHIPAPRQKM